MWGGEGKKGEGTETSVLASKERERRRKGEGGVKEEDTAVCVTE